MKTQTGTPFEKHHANAIRAVYAGKGTPEQQRISLEWVMQNACRVKDMCDAGEDIHRTFRLLGRRDAGLDVAEMLSTKIGAIEEEEHG